MAPERQAALLRFLAFSDGLKHIRRAARTGERRENSAEHCWQVALPAVMLAAEAEPAPELGRVLAMAAVHDLVEIEAGDTFAFDDAHRLTQEDRERRAADRLFGSFPGLRALWDEFEAAVTPKARFAMGCDRLQGFAQQVRCGAPAWHAVGLTRARSLVRMQPVLDLGAPFAPLLETLYAEATAKGLLAA